MPKRIQRKRTKGWKMPEGALYVGRPSQWSNHFVIGFAGDAQTCVLLYKYYAVEPMLEIHGEEYFAELRGKDLACWCPLDQPCHADILLEVANKGQS